MLFRVRSLLRPSVRAGLAALLIAALAGAGGRAAAQDAPPAPPLAPQIGPDAPAERAPATPDDLPLLEEAPSANPFVPGPPDAPVVVDRHDNSLDDLFARLAAAKSAREAHPFEQRILKRFLDSGSATVDLLMGAAHGAIAGERYGEALDLLDNVIVLKPDFAEAYNKRATVHFLLDDYGRSLEDIERTLALEPRHFGALSGLAGILRRLDQPEKAYAIYSRLHAIHPNLEDAVKAIEKLAPDVEGRPI